MSKKLDNQDSAVQSNDIQMSNIKKDDFLAVLDIQKEWGADCVIGESPVDRLKDNLQQFQFKRATDLKDDINEEVDNVLSQQANEISKSTENKNFETKHFVKNPIAINKDRTVKNILSTEKLIVEAKNIASQCENLNELRAAIEEFEGCLLKNTAKSTVFAAGNPDSKIMLLGEAPGADEDRQGLPFVGRSGKLLDKIFASISLTREKNLYITNCLPWRPPGNRTPSQQEIAICLPFLLRHIQLVSPKILVLVGATALHALNGLNGPLSSFRNNWYKFNPYLDGDISLELISKGSCYKNDKVLETVVKFIHSQKDSGIATYITYHPSYLLRSPVNKKKVWLDMLDLQRVAENC